VDRKGPLLEPQHSIRAQAKGLFVLLSSKTVHACCCLQDGLSIVDTPITTTEAGSVLFSGGLLTLETSNEAPMETAIEVTLHSIRHAKKSHIIDPPLQAHAALIITTDVTIPQNEVRQICFQVVPKMHDVADLLVLAATFGPSIVAEGILLLMGDGRLFSVIQSFFQVEPADTHGATETQEA